MADKDYTNVLLEDINGKFDAILNAVGGMQDNVKHIPDIVERVQNLENEMKAVRLATTDTNSDVKEVKSHIQKADSQISEIQSRLSALESA